MEFKLNEYHRNVPEGELIEDLIRVAGIHQKPSITQKEYMQHGKYASRTIVIRFGSWNEALKKAGLVLERGHFKTHLYCESDKVFFEDVQAVAIQLGQNYVSTEEYAKYGKYSHGSKLKKYKSWNAIMRASGLGSMPFRTGLNLKFSDEELFQEIERVWIKLGRQPTITDVKNGEFNIGISTFNRHFGGWRSALEAFVKFINSEDISESSSKNDSNSINDVTNYAKTDSQNLESSNTTTHTTKREINLRLRFRVMARDNFKCCKCGKSPATDPSVILHVDHIKPWAKGGETTIDNLQTLCSECNLGKSDLIFE